MTLLFIDTTTRTLSLALLNETRLLGQVMEARDKGHAEAIFPLMAAMLSKAKVSVSAIDTLIAVTGPGSFTSVRIGLSVIKGLGLGLQAKSAGIDRLALLALGALYSMDHNKYRSGFDADGVCNDSDIDLSSSTSIDSTAEYPGHMVVTSLIHGRGRSFFAAQYALDFVHKTIRLHRPAQSIDDEGLRKWEKSILVTENTSAVGRTASAFSVDDMFSQIKTIPVLTPFLAARLATSKAGKGLLTECDPFYVRPPDLAVAQPLFSVSV